MNIRVTQQAQSRMYLNSMNMSLNQMNKLNNQFLRQRQFFRASENSVGAAKALTARRYLSDMATHEDNLSISKGIFDTAEATLTKNVSQRTHDVTDKIISAVNADKGQHERDIIAAEIENIARDMMKDLNSDFAGRRLFGGTNNASPCFKFDDANNELLYNGVPVNWSKVTEKVEGGITKYFFGGTNISQDLIRGDATCTPILPDAGVPATKLEVDGVELTAAYNGKTIYTDTAVKQPDGSYQIEGLTVPQELIDNGKVKVVNTIVQEGKGTYAGGVNIEKKLAGKTATLEPLTVVTGTPPDPDSLKITIDGVDTPVDANYNGPEIYTTNAVKTIVTVNATYRGGEPVMIPDPSDPTGQAKIQDVCLAGDPLLDANGEQVMDGGVPKLCKGGELKMRAKGEPILDENGNNVTVEKDEYRVGGVLIPEKLIQTGKVKVVDSVEVKYEKTYVGGNEITKDQAEGENSNRFPGTKPILIDVGYGMQFDENGVPDPNTALDLSINGVHFTGNGTSAESGLSNNIVQLTFDAAKALRAGDNTAALDLLDQITKVNGSLLIGITNLGVKEQAIDYQVSKLATDKMGLIQNQTDAELLDTVGLAEVSTQVKLAQAAYNATLQLGSEVIPTSIFDFMR